MSEVKHTPGPWTCGGGAYLPIDANTSHGPAQIGRAESFGHISDEEVEANGRLMAAAPDLLTALKACLAYIPGSEVRSWAPGFKLREEALRLGKAAIAKAT